MEGATHLLFPNFEIGVSLNGHIQDFILGPRVYTDILEDDDVNAFSFPEMWIYISDHIHEFLLDIVGDVGPIDPDTVRLVSLTIHVMSSPENALETVDCDGCAEEYHEKIAELKSDEDSEEYDD